MNNNTNELDNLIIAAVEQRVKKEMETILERSKEELMERIPALINEITVEITRQLECEILGEKIIFTISKK